MLSNNYVLRPWTWKVFRVMMSVTVFAWKRWWFRLYLQFVVGGLMFYLHYLCVLEYSGIQHMLTIWLTWRVSYKRQEWLCGCLDSLSVLGGDRSFQCSVFLVFALYLVYPMLPVLLDCPFLIASSVFFYDYYERKHIVDGNNWVHVVNPQTFITILVDDLIEICLCWFTIVIY